MMPSNTINIKSIYKKLHQYRNFNSIDKKLTNPHLFMKNPKYACFYAIDFIKGRWLEAEPYIMQDPYWAYFYAREIIKGRWPEAEPTIMQNFKIAFYYAIHVIKGRWLEAEPTIMQDQYYQNLYNKLTNNNNLDWNNVTPYGNILDTSILEMNLKQTALGIRVIE